MVHLSAVKQEFQLEIQPLPIMSKTVRASFCLWSTLILRCSLLSSAKGRVQLDLQRLHLGQPKVCCTLSLSHVNLNRSF
jgi:hypothetical protein